MRFLKNIILQVGIICGFAYMITRILDWYNPYMDFSGHMWYLLIGVFGSALLLLVLPGCRGKDTDGLFRKRGA